jgi:hypothetical protein
MKYENAKRWLCRGKQFMATNRNCRDKNYCVAGEEGG